MKTIYILLALVLLTTSNCIFKPYGQTDYVYINTTDYEIDVFSKYLVPPKDTLTVSFGGFRMIIQNDIKTYYPPYNNEKSYLTIYRGKDTLCHDNVAEGMSDKEYPKPSSVTNRFNYTLRILAHQHAQMTYTFDEVDLQKANTEVCQENQDLVAQPKPPCYKKIVNGSGALDCDPYK